jgi:subtilisin family serine protease
MQMGLGIDGEESEVEVYQEVGYLQNKSEYPDYQDAQSTHNIHFPSSDPSVICVGATSYKTGFLNFDGQWMDDNWGSGGDVATYSSRGPTLSGLTKPDVLAPGTNIVAGFNSYFCEMNPDYHYANFDVSCYTFNGRTYSWTMQKGTSMSCPIVAGIIAQWMEAIPTLTREQVIEAFAATCRHPNPSVTYPNNDYGYGEIDAEAGLNYLMGQYDGLTPALSKGEGEGAVYDLCGRKLTKGGLSRGIYIMGGRKVVKQ